MEKKTINLKEASFTQAINISAQWCKEWGEDLLSDEVYEPLAYQQKLFAHCL